MAFARTPRAFRASGLQQENRVSHREKGEADTAFKEQKPKVHTLNIPFFNARKLKKKMKISIIKIQLSQTINWYFLTTMSPHPWISRTCSKNTVPLWTLGRVLILIFSRTSSNSLYVLQRIESRLNANPSLFQWTLLGLPCASVLHQPDRRRVDLRRGLGVAFQHAAKPKKKKEAERPPRGRRDMTTNAQGPGSPSLPAQHFSLEPGGVNTQLASLWAHSQQKWHQKPSSKKYHYGW